MRALRDERHISFLTDLDLAAHGDHAAAIRAMKTMSDAGAVRESLEKSELLRFRASQALPAPLADLPGDHPLRALLRIYSLV
jgi:hypothetical protein